MFVITLKDHPQGVYSVLDEDDDRIIPIFENREDAFRYVNLLGVDEENPKLDVVTVQLEQMVQACSMSGQRYSIITTDDFIVPPDTYDHFPKDPLEEPPEHGKHV
tara:strand:- start:5086 stop:5400 length:315 start_codon:yes stop_codon:yes gene_type:complete